MLVACVRVPQDSEISKALSAIPIYPDYKDVMVPVNIAPLNFVIMDEGVDAHDIEISLGNELIYKDTSRGGVVSIEQCQWKEMLNRAAGKQMSVRLAIKKGDSWEGESWTIEVSGDSIDSYLTYRLIEPGFEVWHALTIEERCIETFETRTLADNKELNMQCMNCHIHGRDGQTSMFYIRGENGGAMLYRNGRLGKVNLRSSKMDGGAVYGDIDKSGRYGVFSTNVIIPALHSTDNRRLEVFDTKSDLCVADFDDGKMIVAPQVADTTTFETFPAFSADGKKVYYCSANMIENLIDSIGALHYSICSIGFENGEWGTKIDTLWSASRNGGSANFPKASPDGKFLLFCRSDCGTFPIWHKETDLWMIDLENGNAWPLEKANSDRSDTYHTWSSNSRWIAFASKRGDGQYGRVYFSHIDKSGKASKAFVMPQRDPRKDLLNLKSYNIPDLSVGAAGYSRQKVEKVFREEIAVQYK